MKFQAFVERGLATSQGINAKTTRKAAVSLLSLLVLCALLKYNTPPARSAPSDLLVFAEAPSLARLDTVTDPSGWFYQLILYNPTTADINVTGLRWTYNSSQKIIDTGKSSDVQCYDKRYFTTVPSTTVAPSGMRIVWEYAPGSISITVPAKKMILTWIEAPTKSVDNADTITSYYCTQAYAGLDWISSPLYTSHAGANNAVDVVFRADFNLTTDPTTEDQTHPNPQWLYKEDRSLISNMSTRVRIIPVASGKGQGIDTATTNITLPQGWTYISGSKYNPYGETVTYFSNSGKDALKWDLTNQVLTYPSNTSLSQNYIEFNVTAPPIPGIYNFTVNSVITSIGGITTTENQNIYTVIKTPPTASFTATPDMTLTFSNITFNASASYDLDGQIASCFWTYGDGNNGTGSTSTHAYAENGSYTVSLTVTDNDGLANTTQRTASIQNRPPVPQFTESAETVDTGTTIYFNASTSYDLDGYIVNYFWDFGDQTNATGTATANHSYPDNGNYTVTLTVTDNDGATSSTNATKIVQNRPPTASFTRSAGTVYTGETVTFNASSSHDPDGSIILFSWDFGDGYTGNGSIVDHAYADNGTYTMILVETDNDGATASSNSTVLVLNRLPTALFTESATTVETGEMIYFNASATYDTDGYVVSFIWDFGDDANSTGATSNHTYAHSGSYNVRLNVTDNDGASATLLHVITVSNRFPVASFTFSPQQPLLGDTMTFDATDSYDPDGTVASFTWDFGDGNTTLTASNTIAHRYSQLGIFNVTLTVTDNEGADNSMRQTVSVNVRNVAVTNVTVSNTQVQIGQSVNITVSVKNKGTTAETFSVSAFCNETMIANRLVTNLSPGADQIIVFVWNTSDVQNPGRFLITVKAGIMPNESDATDNTYTGDIVNFIRAQDNGASVLPRFDWNWLLLLLPVLGVIFGGVLWKRRNGGGELRGFDYFDEITNGGIPDPFSVLIIGEPGSGKSILCQEITYAFLKAERSCMYVTYDCFPAEVRANMRKFHPDVSKLEGRKRFLFIDCFSSIAKVPSKEKYSLAQPFSLSDLGIILSQAMTDTDKSLKVLLDSAVPLLTHVDPLKVVEFLQDRSARIKGVNGTFVFTVGRETIEPSLISRLEEVVDCVIELEASSVGGKIERKLRVKKIQGKRPSDEWVRFEIDPEKGIVFIT